MGTVQGVTTVLKIIEEFHCGIIFIPCTLINSHNGFAHSFKQKSGMFSKIVFKKALKLVLLYRNQFRRPVIYHELRANVAYSKFILIGVLNNVLGSVFVSTRVRSAISTPCGCSTKKEPVESNGGVRMARTKQTCLTPIAEKKQTTIAQI